MTNLQLYAVYAVELDPCSLEEFKETGTNALVVKWDDVKHLLRADEPEKQP